MANDPPAAPTALGPMVISAGAPEPGDGMEALIERYHAQPGKTVAMFEPWRTRDGRSSYDVIAGEVDASPRDSRLLDLGCGDGYLLASLARRGFTDLVGVDASPAEISRARERLGSRAELHRGDARDLPLPARSVDVVSCHLALMLMAPIEPVLAEIARVLRPGGYWVAVINQYVEDPVYEVYRRALHRTMVEAGMPRLRLGDARVSTVEGFAELIGGANFEDLTVRDFEVRTRVAPSALWSMLRLMYDVFRLPDAAQVTLEQRVLRGWEPRRDEEGLLGCTMGMRLLRCRMPGAGPR